LITFARFSFSWGGRTTLEFQTPPTYSSFGFPSPTLPYLKGNVRELIWVPFRIVIPTSAVVPVQLMVEAPTANNRAIFHLHTIRFPHFNCPVNGSGGWDFCSNAEVHHNSQGDYRNPGQNILGTNMWIDIERIYDMTKVKSDKITTHMQVDKIMVDFGLLTNAGDILP
jgi:hypothetical protein